MRRLLRFAVRLMFHTFGCCTLFVIADQIIGNGRVIVPITLLWLSGAALYLVEMSDERGP